MSSIEAGRRRPSAAALGHFAEKLGVGDDELTTGRPPDLAAQLEILLQDARKLISTGRFADAMGIYKQVERDAKRYELLRLRARAVQGLALCAEREGEIERAIELYEEAEDVVKTESPIARADIVAGKARCLQMLGDTRYAAYVLEILLESLERSGLRDPDALVRIHSSLVAAYFELGLYRKASASVDIALKLSSNASDPEQLANMHINAARVLLHDGRQAEAEDSLRKAEDLPAVGSQKRDWLRISRPGVHRCPRRSDQRGAREVAACN